MWPCRGLWALSVRLTVCSHQSDFMLKQQPLDRYHRSRGAPQVAILLHSNQGNGSQSLGVVQVLTDMACQWHVNLTTVFFPTGHRATFPGGLGPLTQQQQLHVTRMHLHVKKIHATKGVCRA